MIAKQMNKALNPPPFLKLPKFDHLAIDLFLAPNSTSNIYFSYHRTIVKCRRKPCICTVYLFTQMRKLSARLWVLWQNF